MSHSVPSRAIAYIDNFKLMLILAIASLPLTLFIRSKIGQTKSDEHAAVLE